jgi:uncharacterized protein (TIGR00369 family)
MPADSMRDLATKMASLSGLEALRAITSSTELPPNFGAHLGMRADEVEFGRVVFSILTEPHFANPLGTVHGGIYATVLDSAMGSAVHSTLEPGVGYGTLELKVNYIRPVPTDGRRLVATATVIHVGRTTATAEGRMTTEDGKLVAHGTTTCVIHR